MQAQLHQLEEQVEEIYEESKKRRFVIDTHPIMFMILVILFFVTMDLWSKAIHDTLLHFYPRHKFYYWEYIILALIALGILLYMTKKTGLSIRVVGEG